MIGKTIYSTSEFDIKIEGQTKVLKLGNGYEFDFFFEFVNKIDPKKRLNRKLFNQWIEDANVRSAILEYMHSVIDHPVPDEYGDCQVINGPLFMRVWGNCFRICVSPQYNTNQLDEVWKYLENDEKWSSMYPIERHIPMPCWGSGNRGCKVCTLTCIHKLP